VALLSPVPVVRATLTRRERRYARTHRLFLLRNVRRVHDIRQRMVATPTVATATVAASASLASAPPHHSPPHSDMPPRDFTAPPLQRFVSASFINYFEIFCCFQCFDAVGWVAGRASGL